MKPPTEDSARRELLDRVKHWLIDNDYPGWLDSSVVHKLMAGYGASEYQRGREDGRKEAYCAISGSTFTPPQIPTVESCLAMIRNLPGEEPKP